MTERDSPATAVEQVKEVVDRAQRLRPARVFQHYASANGPLLAAGMAYQSLFALFAAVWVGFSIAGIWVRSNELLYDQLIRLVNQAVPNLIGDGGAISTRTLDAANLALTYTAVIAFAALVWTALGWLSSTRTAIRTIFGVGNDKRNFFVQRSIDAVQAIAFGVGLIVSALIALLTTQVLDLILLELGFDGSSPMSQIGVYAVTVIVSLLINFGTLAAMYRVLSRLYIPWRNLLVGAGVGAVALSALSQASSLLLRGASRNPALAGFAGFVALLLWFNFVCQVILIAASWIAVGMEDRGLSARRMSAEEAARERLRQEYERDLEEARRAVRTANEVYERVTGWRRRRSARRLLLRALRHLRVVTANDPDRGQKARPDA
ncbi:YihY/virulence factor BrkB family protein [Gryllotalpicola koreensis]|uniref:YihY/virulence factor BrkB family protein n=1 Tax=Gryllotalpicola koreensis TaxID=993086 RepID=A0ABP8A141_9MICO